MIDAPLFGILILDRDPLTFAHFWGLLQAWLQIAGGCAAVGLAAYLLYAMLGTSDSESNKIRMPVNYKPTGRNRPRKPSAGMRPMTRADYVQAARDKKARENK